MCKTQTINDLEVVTANSVAEVHEMEMQLECVYGSLSMGLSIMLSFCPMRSVYF